jgi:hypothetical protein
MVCKSCGHEIETDYEFCPQCGKALQDNCAEAATEAPVQAQENLPAKKKSKKAVFLLTGAIGLCVVLALVVLILFVFQQKPNKNTIPVDNHEFLITATEYQKRFNQEATGGLTKIRKLNVSESYGHIFSRAQLEPNLSILILSKQDTKNVISIQLKGDIDKEITPTIQNYLLCVFHSCDPTATPEDDIEFLDTIQDIKVNEYDLSAESSFYRKNGISYRLSIDLESTNFIVTPGPQKKLQENSEIT